MSLVAIVEYLQLCFKPNIYRTVPEEMKLLSPVKQGDIGFSFSVRPSVRLSVRSRVQAVSPKVLDGKFLNCTHG